MYSFRFTAHLYAGILVRNSHVYYGMSYLQDILNIDRADLPLIIKEVEPLIKFRYLINLSGHPNSIKGQRVDESWLYERAAELDLIHIQEPVP